MRTMRALGLASLLAGGLLIAYAAMQGNVRVGLFLIVPFVYGTGLAPFLGMLLVMAGLFMLAVSSFTGMVPPRGEWVEGERRVESRSGGVVLLGPIPIVWGHGRSRSEDVPEHVRRSDRRVLPWTVAAGAALLLLALWLTWGPR